MNPNKALWEKGDFTLAAYDGPMLVIPARVRCGAATLCCRSASAAMPITWPSSTFRAAASAWSPAQVAA